MPGRARDRAWLATAHGLTMADLALARARSLASKKKQAAFAQWCFAETDEDRTIAEREWNAAEAELGALPSLVSAEAIARMRAIR